MIGMTSFAQESPKLEKRNREKMETLTPEQRQELHLKKLTADLNLTSTQQKEFSILLQENYKKREALKIERKAKKEELQKHHSEERKAMKSRMLEEKAAMTEKVKKILSADQLAKWEKMQEDRKDGMKRKFKHGDKKSKKQ